MRVKATRMARVRAWQRDSKRRRAAAIAAWRRRWRREHDTCVAVLRLHAYSTRVRLVNVHALDLMCAERGVRAQVMEETVGLLNWGIVKWTGEPPDPLGPSHWALPKRSVIEAAAERARKEPSWSDTRVRQW